MSHTHRPTAATPASVLLPNGTNPEAFFARQDAMIQAGTHAMLAERLALDAVRNQAERELRARNATTPPPAPEPATAA